MGIDIAGSDMNLSGSMSCRWTRGSGKINWFFSGVFKKLLLIVIKLTDHESMVSALIVTLTLSYNIGVRG